MDCRKIIEEHNNNKRDYDEFTKAGFKAFWITIVLLIGLVVVNFAFDPLNFRYINQFKLYNNKTKQEMKLKEIINKSKQYENIPFDYSSQLRNENIDISGYINIEKIEPQANGAYTITGEHDFKWGDSSLKIVIWCTKIENIEDCTKRTKVNFTGKINGINEDWIIINEGEIKK